MAKPTMYMYLLSIVTYTCTLYVYYVGGMKPDNLYRQGYNIVLSYYSQLYRPLRALKILT